jgi:hypothetical protein
VIGDGCIASREAVGALSPRLLIHELDGCDRLDIARELRRSGAQVDTLLIGDPSAEETFDRQRIEVAAIKLTSHAGGLVFASELVQRSPWVQLVFWASEHGTGAHVARSLGISRLLTVSQISQWLAAAVGPLARLARARRAALEAEATIPSVPEMPSETGAPTLALPEAERQFRESYLRQLLSESPSAKKAAERAGVPYTTLCSMMKKLGLSKGSLNA